MDANVLKIRLFICDDSIFMRMAIKTICEEHPLIEIIGEATEGGEAIEAISETKPDVVIMDLDMPGVDGIEATETIMREHNIPIIILSGLTERRSVLATKSLEIGAVDVIWKSASLMDIDIGGIADTILEKIVFWGGHPKSLNNGKTAPDYTPKAKYDAILMCLGEGGPHALQHSAANLHPNSPPIIILADIPSSCVDGFVRFSTRITGLPSQEISDTTTLKPGHIFIVNRATQYQPDNAQNEAQICAVSLGVNELSAGMSEFIKRTATLFQNPLAIVMSGAPALPESWSLFSQKGHDIFVQSPPTCIVPTGCEILLSQHIPSWETEPATLLKELANYEYAAPSQ